MAFNTAFVPQGCTDSLPETAITVAAGHLMGDVYAELKQRNLSFVGAAEPNVGLGGYLTGGGHGPLSAMYGLAVDNVLEMAVAMPQGDIVLANACQNENLFWAMRGVGGLLRRNRGPS